MNQKTLSKILAVMLVITLTFANFLFLAIYAGKSYASNVNYENQETNIEKTGISFDAYFISDTGEKTHTKVTEMNNSELKLILSVSVTKGYLKDGIVSIEDANFKIVEGEELPEGVEEVDKERNTIKLKQINKGEEKEIKLPVEVVKDEKFDLSNFSKEAKISLEGNYVNDTAKEKEIEKSIVVKLSISENAETSLAGDITKHAIFEEEGKQKELVQIKVTSGVENSLLPIRETEIKVEVPKLNEKTPEYISIVSTSTKATNGKTGEEFGIENYTCKEGIITIQETNQEEGNKVSWLKEVKDEYIINLVYEAEEESTGKIELNIKSKLSLYNNEEKVLEKEIKEEREIPEASQNVVSYEIENEEEEIAKGYMIVKEARETEYSQAIKVNIGYSPIVQNIEINKGSEYYTDKNENKYTATTYYKTIKVEKENLEKILGKEGTIEILKGEEKLGTLNAENTEYVFKEEISEVRMVASEPKLEGTLVVKTQKYIKSAEYNAKITNALNKMTTTILGTTNNMEEQSQVETELVEPTLQISTSISDNKLSTVIENENVELRVALQTNNNTNRLFKNPKIEIELPSYIKEVEMKNVNLLYNTELKATKGRIGTSETGNKVITVELEGEQTKFNDVLSVEGMTLIIGTDLTVEQTAPSTTQEMVVKVTNNGTETVEEREEIEYVAPTGMITINSIRGYNSKNETATSMSGETEVGKLTVLGERKTATQIITVINNYDYNCGEVEILGRTPVEGNKEIGAEKELGSTFTAKMVNGIRVEEGIESENITIYYSENGEATEEIEDTTNGWTTNREEIETVKSYLIKIAKEMKKGDKILLSYDVEIPEGLSREESTYSMYKVNYTNMDGTLKGIEESVKSNIVGVSTGGGAELKIDLTANVENGAQVKEGQIIEYTAKVTNIGKVTAENVKFTVDIPSWSYYVKKQIDLGNEVYISDSSIETYTETIETINPSETKEVKFMLKTGPIVKYETSEVVIRDDYNTDEEYENAKTEFATENMQYGSTDVRVIAKAQINEENEDVIFSSNELVNQKVEGYFELKLSNEGIPYEAGNYQRYSLAINKLGLEDYHNVKITCKIPKELEYVSSDINDTVKQQIDGSTITWTVDELTNNESIDVIFLIKEVKKNTTVSLQMVGTCDECDEQIKSNSDVFTLGVPKLEIGHTSSNATGQITEGNEINYMLTVKNTGDVNAYNVKITDYVSDGLMLNKVKYTKGTEIVEFEKTGKDASITIDILANETLTIELTAKVISLKVEEQTKTVSNRFEVEANGIEKIESSTITHTVNKRVFTYDENEEQIVTHSISGLAWLDENANGIRELDEEVLPQITVVLLNESGKRLATSITNENGGYIFNNLTNGNYMIAFLYDMANYDVTLYQTEDANTNNDTVTMKVNIDGISTECAATNIIGLSTSNIDHIDLGLIVSKKFDLSLEKTISKITIQNSNGTTTNTYNNSKLQKIEIPSKEINSSTVAVEYVITVKNEGAIAGYAKRVVDYLSGTDLKFSSETNPDWYLGTDGNLYNSTLANTLLQPGESKTLTLVLTKKVSENNTGITNNTAEIYEAFNDEGLEDYNSTPANKVSSENDLGQADIIIGPKTGVVLYLGTVLIVMVVLAVGIYILNKKVIRRI